MTEDEAIGSLKISYLDNGSRHQCQIHFVAVYNNSGIDQETNHFYDEQCCQSKMQS